MDTVQRVVVLLVLVGMGLPVLAVPGYSYPPSWYDGHENWATRWGLPPNMTADLMREQSTPTYSAGSTSAATAKKAAEAAVTRNGRTASVVLEKSRALLKSPIVGQAKALAKFGGPTLLIMGLTPVLTWLLDPETEEGEWRKPEVWPWQGMQGQWRTSRYQKVSGDPNAACKADICQGNPVYCSTALSNVGPTATSGSCIGYVGGGSLGTVTRISACTGGKIWEGTGCRDLITTLATDEQLETAISDALDTADELAAQASKNAEDVGAAQAQDLDTTGPTSVTGPSSSSAVTSTSSSTVGGVTTVVTTSTQNFYTYGGDVINVREHTTETTCVDGVCETEERDDSGTIPMPEEPPTSTSDFCAENPDASACAPLDVPAGGEELGTATRDLSWTSERTAAGSCPAPLEIHSFVAGDDFEISYDPICQVVIWMRPLIIGMAWLSAGLYVFLMARREVG